MKRLVLLLGIVLLIGFAASAYAQVGISVRIGPQPRYVVPVGPVIYPVAHVYYQPYVYQPYVAPFAAARPVFVARPVAYCGPVCRAELRERRFVRAEVWERWHDRW